MTNRQRTKQIMKAAKTQTGEQLLITAVNLMRRFPLSSEKLIYDRDAYRVTPEAWGILLQAAIQTDKEKLDSCNRILVGFRLKSYGRYNGK